MKIAVITLFPKMFAALEQEGIVARALKENQAELFLVNPRDYAIGRYRRVDDRPYGGGPGMVMLAEPLFQALQVAKAKVGDQAKVIYLSPQGQILQHQTVHRLSEQESFILISGRYEGIDQRFIDLYVDRELSIGDYVVSGGELPAMIVVDAVIRLLPGVIEAASQASESFVTESFDYPVYTRPEVWQNQAVPDILLSGHHREITTWRQAQGLRKFNKRCT